MTTAKQERMYREWKEESKREWKKFNNRLEQFAKDCQKDQINNSQIP